MSAPTVATIVAFGVTCLSVGFMVGHWVATRRWSRAMDALTRRATQAVEQAANAAILAASTAAAGASLKGGRK